MNNEKVYIRCKTVEERQIASDFCRESVKLSKFIVNENWGEYIVFKGLFPGCHTSSPDSGYEIISYEDFERDYLKKEPKEYSKYYKCIKKYLGLGEVVGRIYKHQGNTVFYYNKKETFSCTKSPKEILEYLIPSTIEEYNAQFAVKLEEHPIIGECYTVTDTIYPGELMVGRIISINEGSTHGNIRGKADFIATFGKRNSIDINKSWCYSDGSGRTFRKSTPEEIQWLDACIKANKFIPKEEALKSKIMKYNFEVGKYYYFEAYNTKQPTYIKVSNIDDVGVEGEYFIYLTGKDTGNYYIGIGRWSLDQVNNPREATLSELSHYLPAGHPDKMPVLLTPEEGKWYKCQLKMTEYYSYERIWLFKSLKKEGKRTWGSKGVYLKNGSKFMNNAIANDKEILSLEPADMEEVYKYFPEEKPKIEEITQKSMKFNIGDKVKFKTSIIGYIPSYGSDHSGIPRDIIRHGQTTFKENKGEIVNTYEDWYIVSFTDTLDRNVRLGFKEDVLEPYIEEKPKPTNLVGRWVKCLKDEAWSSTFKNEFVKKDKFYQLYDIRGDYYGLEGGNYCGLLRYGEDQEKWKDIGFELMPEGWTPKSEEKVDNERIPQVDDWCVKNTKENIKDIIEYFKKFHNKSYQGGAPYYGVKKGSHYCSNTSWGQTISTEEFYKLAGSAVKYPKNLYAVGIDPYGVEEVQEKRIEINLKQPKKGGILDTKVNSTYSVDGMLVKPKKVVLF